MSSTSNDSHTEIHLPLATIRINLGQGLRKRSRDTEHFQTSIRDCLSQPSRSVTSTCPGVLVAADEPLAAHAIAAYANLAFPSVPPFVQHCLDSEREGRRPVQRVVFGLATAQCDGALRCTPVLDQMRSPHDSHSRSGFSRSQISGMVCVTEYIQDSRQGLRFKHKCF